MLNVKCFEVSQNRSRSSKRVVRGFARLRFSAVVFVLWRRIPVRVPSRRMIPKGETSLDQLRRLWDDNLRWLRDHVDHLQQGNEDCAYFSHPVSGPITTAEAVRMGRLHFDSHRQQIDRLLEQKS